MTRKQIKAKFDNLDVHCFEINLKDNIEIEEDEFIIAHFNYNEETNNMELGSVFNIGFAPYAFLEYDNFFSFDQNLEALYEEFLNLSINLHTCGVI